MRLESEYNKIDMNEEKSSEKNEEIVVSCDKSSDVILTDDEGDRVASMREYLFIHLASSSN